MSDYNWCHGPECHTKQTQSRIRGSGENKVLRTIKVKVHDYSNHHWFQGWENHFCKVTCFFDYMKIVMYLLVSYLYFHFVIMGW